MSSVISKLPPVSPPDSGVRDGDKLMRTVRLSGDYQSDVPLIIPSCAAPPTLTPAALC